MPPLFIYYDEPLNRWVHTGVPPFINREAGDQASTPLFTPFNALTRVSAEPVHLLCVNRKVSHPMDSIQPRFPRGVHCKITVDTRRFGEAVSFDLSRQLDCAKSKLSLKLSKPVTTFRIFSGRITTFLVRVLPTNQSALNSARSTRPGLAGA